MSVSKCFHDGAVCVVDYPVMSHNIGLGQDVSVAAAVRSSWFAKSQNKPKQIPGMDSIYQTEGLQQLDVSSEVFKYTVIMQYEPM